MVDIVSPLHLQEFSSDGQKDLRPCQLFSGF